MSLRILMVTRLFPSSVFPTAGTFCAERAKALAQYADVRVLVPTPYWPSSLPFGPWKAHGAVEHARVTPEDIPVHYPRYLSIPRIATWTQGRFMSWGIRRYLQRHGDAWRPDLIHGHYAFPDGYAAIQLAKFLGCYGFVTCHGGDLRLYPPLFRVSAMMRWTFEEAHRVITVSPALAERAAEVGAPPQRVRFLPNGVDTALFGLQDKHACRRHLGLAQDGPVAVCVGALCDPKDQGILVRSLAELKRRGSRPPRLVLVGGGPNRQALLDEVASLGLEQHVQLAGPKPYDEILWWMGAADWLVLSSHHEGWPTVYFEAMACGRPVITSNVAAARAAVCDPRYGIVVEPNTPEAFAQAFEEAQSRTFDASAIRAYAEQHSWDQWARSVLAFLEEVQAEQNVGA